MLLSIWRQTNKKEREKLLLWDKEMSEETDFNDMEAASFEASDMDDR